MTTAAAAVTDDPKVWRALAFVLDEFAHFKPHARVPVSEKNSLPKYQEIAARMARGLWRRIIEARANEPHGYRGLALALINEYKRDQDGQQHVIDEAVKCLTQVTMREWSDRFAAMQVEVNALEELNSLVNAHWTQQGLINAQNWKSRALELNPRLASLLVQALPCDLR
jgi:hypothetical protein